MVRSAGVSCRESVTGKLDAKSQNLDCTKKKKHSLSYFNVCWLDVFLLSAMFMSEETELSNIMLDL